MDILRKIEALFEQEFRVHTEPVKSALLQTVTDVVRDVWGSKYGAKYANMRSGEVINSLGKPENWKRLSKNARDLKTYPPKVHLNSFLMTDFIKQGITDSSFMWVMDGIKDITKKPDAIAASKMLKAVIDNIEELNKITLTPPEKINKLLENIERYKYPVAIPMLIFDMIDHMTYSAEKETAENKASPEGSKTGQAYAAGAKGTI